MENLYEQSMETKKQITEMHNHFKFMRSKYPDMLSPIDRGELIDFNVLHKKVFQIDLYEWKKYVNLLEKYYHQHRLCTMFYYANMNESKLDAEKKNYMEKLAGYYGVINGLHYFI